MTPDKLYNIGILAHVDAGKANLIEQYIQGVSTGICANHKNRPSLCEAEYNHPAQKQQSPLTEV